MRGTFAKQSCDFEKQLRVGKGRDGEVWVLDEERTREELDFKKWDEIRMGYTLLSIVHNIVENSNKTRHTNVAGG